MKKISLCMIVLNEEEFLAKALTNVKNFVHEIIVVDGGSTDKTVQVAQKFGAKVFYKKWGEHYADQRNFALSKAKGDWVLVMDADEIFEPKLLMSLQKLASNNLGIDLFAFPRKNFLDGKQTISYPDRQYRFFLNNHKIKYMGRMHEQPVGWKFAASPMTLHIIHKKSTVRQKKQSEHYKKIAFKFKMKEQMEFYGNQKTPGLPTLKK